MRSLHRRLVVANPVALRVGVLPVEDQCVAGLCAGGVSVYTTGGGATTTDGDLANTTGGGPVW